MLPCSGGSPRVQASERKTIKSKRRAATAQLSEAEIKRKQRRLFESARKRLDAQKRAR